MSGLSGSQTGAEVLDGWTPPANAVDVLARALDVLDTYGWTQGEGVDPETGCVCALGALGAGALGYELYRDSYGSPNASASKRFSESIDAYLEADALLITVVAELTAGRHGVVGFNDTPGRTREEVRSALVAALDRARAVHAD